MKQPTYIKQKINLFSYYAKKIDLNFKRFVFKSKTKVNSDAGKISIEIIEYNKLNSKQIYFINRLFIDTFKVKLNTHEKIWARPDYAVLGYIDEKFALYYYFVIDHATVDNKKTKIGGFGGLVCDPVYRRFGFTKDFINETWDQLCNKFSIDYGLLICSKKLTGFYEKFGWYEIEPEIHFEENQMTNEMNFHKMFYNPSKEVYLPLSISLSGKLW